MTKRRTVDPRIRVSETFSCLTYRQRDLWVGLILVADDQGRMPGQAAYIRSAVWPYDDIPLSEIETDLKRLESIGNILRYQVDGRTYIQLVNWHKYQANAEWLGVSDYPAPDGWIDHARYHGKGNKIFTLNWENREGEISRNVGSALPSQLPSALPSNDDEGDVNDDADDNVNGEVEAEGAPKPTAAAALTRPVIFAIYEREIGPLTPMIGDQLQEFERDYPPEWFEMAVREAITHNKRNLAYVAAILKRWKVDGPVGLRAAVPKGDGSPGVASPLKEKNDAIIADLLRRLEQ